MKCCGWYDAHGSSEEKDRPGSVGSKGFTTLDSKPTGRKNLYPKGTGYGTRYGSFGGYDRKVWSKWVWTFASLGNKTLEFTSKGMVIYLAMF